ncbi:sigma-70 family RNA polymerase sigma factor [Ornithinibacillus sp. L9]|uniref:RNA polymerase sigma factor n=1 Tax=Ornithinibacillus caprae TaxID=2678566 RepID=A0A6N8FH66_9BACI|nr:RNA polymerase sigma factor [Ornithinibacillus caprae]MUK88561.1 sigma-70 family RNA polymerase sigma factor [Ornithinibacillus caprae]
MHMTEQKRENEELVERARGGDQEAFSDLVRMHRAKALGWANSITKDSFLAEDIVQDALIRAFLKLGTLMDTNKFIPWLRQIVRNQAYMKLRRGGQYGKEMPICGFALDHQFDQGQEFQMDWGNVDRILFFLSYSAKEKSEHSDPSAHVMRLEVLQGIHSLLHCLSKRERAIFEAHFFGEIPPSEIAALFGMNKSNVYNTLSRSRAKVQKERIRVSIRDYVRSRSEQGLPKRKILKTPPKL